MSKTTSKTEIKVTVNINPRLAEVTPLQCQQWKRFWAKLISQVEDEVKANEHWNP